ncbi:SHOCT domain-containing protein [Oceanobacillus salinisoli]
MSIYKESEYLSQYPEGASQIEKLADLRDSGILTKVEFNTKERLLLGN